MDLDPPSLRDIFLEAAELETDPARAVYLDAACAGNEALRRRVEELLEAEAQAGPFVEASPVLCGCDPALGSRIGRYQLREQIGEGGCGVVFLAEQREPFRREVALKIIKLGLDTRQVVA